MKTLKLIFLLTIPVLFFNSCHDESKKDTTITPMITLYGKPIDTVNLNANYQDPHAYVTTHEILGEYAQVTGKVNTSIPGIYYLKYDYTDESGTSAATITRTVHVLLNRNDSIKIQEVFALYQNINISKNWTTKDKIAQQINLDINSQPLIYLNYSIGSSFKSFKVTEVKNSIDSLVLTTTAQLGDTIFLWTFRPINKTKGTWSVLKKQSNYYKKLGTFLSADKKP